jgi:hypothetical protein
LKITTIQKSIWGISKWHIDFQIVQKKFNVSYNVVGLHHENKFNGQKLWSFEKS